MMIYIKDFKGPKDFKDFRDPKDFKDFRDPKDLRVSKSLKSPISQ